MDPWKRRFLVKTIIFKGYVGSRECTPAKKSKKLPRLDVDFSSRQAKKKHPAGKNCPPNKKAGTWVYAWTCFRINLFIDYPQSMYFSNKYKGGKSWFKSVTLRAKGNSRFVWKKVRNLRQIRHIQPNFGDFGVTEMDLRWQISCNPPSNYEWVYLHNESQWLVLLLIFPLLQILHMHQGILIFMYTICTRVCVCVYSM